MTLEPIRYLIKDASLPESEKLYVEWRGSTGWVVADGNTVFNSFGEFEWEPLPSSRDKDFIARTRFATPELALENFAKLNPAILG